jgi:hypothetical protein
MSIPAEIIQFPLKKKRGRPKGSKNRVYMPSGQPIVKRESVMKEPHIDSVKHYCFEIFNAARNKDKTCENALVGLLHWFRVNYIDN